MNHRYFHPYILIALILFTPALSPAENLPPPGSLEEALADFPAARNGSEKATRKTAERLQTLIREDGSDSRALAFLGCATAMLSRHTLLIWKKISFAKDGARMMDRAVAQSPDDPVVHLVRAATYLSYPARLGREPALHEDIRFLRAAFDHNLIPAEQIQETCRVFVRYYHRFAKPEERDHFLALIENPETKRELIDMIGGK